MDFLTRTYDLKSFMTTYAFHIALNDATLRGAYAGETYGIGPNSDAAEHIKQYIQDIYDKKYPDFYELANQLKDDLKNYPGFTFGNIQRLINMTAKYMCQSTYETPIRRTFFKNCHCPMDKNMIQRVSAGYKKLMDDHPDQIDRENYYFIVNDKEFHNWNVINWNTIDFYGEGINSFDVYRKFQEMAKVIAEYISKENGEQTYPIELSFIDWDIPDQSSDLAEELKKKTIIQNQAEGIKAAKERGVVFGRPKAELPDNFDEVYKLWAVGQLSNREAAAKLDMPVSTFRNRAEKYKEELKK